MPLFIAVPKGVSWYPPERSFFLYASPALFSFDNRS